MTRTKKLYGFRIGDRVPWWTDRLGVANGRILRLIKLDYCNKFQLLISNGDMYTSEIMIQDEFYKRASFRG